MGAIDQAARDVQRRGRQPPDDPRMDLPRTAGRGAVEAGRWWLPGRAVGYGLPREGQQVAEIDEDAVLATVGTHILERRTELGFSQRDLAAAAGVTARFWPASNRGCATPP